MNSTLKIVNHEYPPNIQRIRETFTLTGREIFAYNNTIYNPAGGELSIPLIEHEKVHFMQQGGDSDYWWDRYLVDPVFRLRQELAAHKKEFLVFCTLNKDRNARARYRNALAVRLSSPMYGSVITTQEAFKQLV